MAKHKPLNWAVSIHARVRAGDVGLPGKSGVGGGVSIHARVRAGDVGAGTSGNPLLSFQSTPACERATLTALRTSAD